MSEDQIEQMVESKINILDRQLLAGKLTQSQYDQEIEKVDKWAERQYNKLSK